jgi:hypothetical protein
MRARPATQRCTEVDCRGAHALCYFDSLLQPRWFAEVIWTPVNLLPDTLTENSAVYWDAAQTFRLG